MTQDNKMTQWQQEALAMFKQQQEAYLESVSNWRKSIDTSKTMGAVPMPPTTPPTGTPVDPAAAMDANRAFMEGVFKQQQEFLEQLTRALDPNQTSS